VATQKTKRPRKPTLAEIGAAIVKSLDAVALEIRRGTAEMRRYRRMVETPGIALEDDPGRGIPEGALLETDRARRIAENEG